MHVKMRYIGRNVMQKDLIFEHIFDHLFGYFCRLFRGFEYARSPQDMRRMWARLQGMRWPEYSK